MSQLMMVVLVGVEEVLPLNPIISLVTSIKYKSFRVMIPAGNTWFLTVSMLA